MSEHTSEPWAVCTEAPNAYWYVGRSIESVPIGSRIADTCVLDANAKENARRIVACVNACFSIPTEWLEENEIASHVATCGLNQHEAEKERDDLRTKLAQLELALKVKDDKIREIIKADKPMPDPHAHSWEAFGRAAMALATEKQFKAIAALAIQPSQEALDEYVMSRLEKVDSTYLYGETLYRLKDK